MHSNLISIVHLVLHAVLDAMLHVFATVHNSLHRHNFYTAITIYLCIISSIFFLSTGRCTLAWLVIDSIVIPICRTNKAWAQPFTDILRLK